jgi:hypothetical protein
MTSAKYKKPMTATLGGIIGILLAAPGASAQANPPPAQPIYRLDLSGLNRLDLRNPAQTRQAWDTLHVAASIQGIVNRDGANLFIRHMPETDDFWWNYLRNENGWLKDRPVIEVRDVADLLRRFVPQLKGVVLYDEKVCATANLASTIAGVEDRLALRYDPSPGSVYSQLAALPEFPKDLLKLFRDDGSPLFTGQGKIPGTDLDSSGSAKNDAYRWAKARYLDAGRCSREYLAYCLDSFWLTNPTLPGSGSKLSNCTLANHDCFISHRTFFIDLGVYGDEVPVDDPLQKPGTDRATLVSLLRAMHDVSGGKILTLCGFLPWGWKYVGPTGGGLGDFPGSGGKRHPVHNEWELPRVASAFNFVKDADALGYSGLADASFYQHFPLTNRYRQNPKPTVADLKARGLILPDDKVKPVAYVTFYMGDYDSGAWLNQFVPQWWADPQHGKVICNWAFNPNLDRRVPHVLDYVRTHQAKTDWFISGDNGAGYLNPGMLTAPPLDPAVPDGWAAWTRHNQDYFHRYDLSITGFIIEGFAPFMGRRGFDEYAKFSPDGLMIGTGETSFGLVALHGGKLPYIRHRLDLDGSPPQAGGVLVAKLAEEKKEFAGGPQFLMPRTILKSPTWHAETMAASHAAPSGEWIEFVDAPTFFLLLKTQLVKSASQP